MSIQEDLITYLHNRDWVSYAELTRIPGFSQDEGGVDAWGVR